MVDEGLLPGGEEDAEIGIPDVEAIVWHEQQRLWRERMEAGRCPQHNVEMIDTGGEEICPFRDRE